MDKKNCPKCKINKSRRKSDRRCLRCKTSHPLTSFDGNGRICENCRIHRSNLVNERNEYFKKYKNECNDYIYETNPSNYEDWENRLRDYPWGFPSHLKDLFTYLTSHGKQNLYYVKIK